MRRGMITLAVLVSLMVSTRPVAAGGFATVRLDLAPGEVVVEVPWTVGFLVQQHDVTPTNDVQVHLDARHRETGETVTAQAHQDGAVGHFAAEVTFPRSGAWKWSITPEPFGPTSFETLTVLDAPGAASRLGSPDADRAHPAQIQRGTCAALGDVAFPLSRVGESAASDGTLSVASGSIGAMSAVAVSISTTTIAAPIAELATGGYAINIQKSEQNAQTSVACGDIGGPMLDGDLIVGLQQLHNSGDVGVAVLHPDTDNRTTVSLYLLVVEEQTAQTAAGSTTAVDVAIVDCGEMWRFDPPHVEIPLGATVTWTNRTAVAHTVTGEALTFADSGLLDPGDSFSQTFTEPGTYSYVCGPHPWMTGTVVVT